MFLTDTIIAIPTSELEEVSYLCSECYGDIRRCACFEPYSPPVTGESLRHPEELPTS